MKPFCVGESVSLGAAIFLHLLLAVRWSAFLGAALVVIGWEGAAAAFEIAGMLCVWGLTVLIGDLGLLCIMLRLQQADVWARRWLWIGAVVACLAAPTMAAAMVWSAPFVGQSLAVGLGYFYLVPALSLFCGSWDVWPWFLYGIWAALENLLGIGVGAALLWSCKGVLAEVDGSFGGDWVWFWRLGIVNLLLGVLALVVQVVVVVLVQSHIKKSIAVGAALAAEAPEGGGARELAPDADASAVAAATEPQSEGALDPEAGLEGTRGDCSTPLGRSDDESAASAQGGKVVWQSVSGALRALLRGSTIAGACWVILAGLLVVPAVVALRFSLGSQPGLMYDRLPEPACAGSYCKVNFAPEEVDAQFNLIYGRAPLFDKMVDLYLDIYSPKGHIGCSGNGTCNSGRPLRPAMVMMHGGAFKFGARDVGGIIKEEGQWLAQHGFVVFNIDYRLLADAAGGLPSIGAVRGAVHDAKAAVRFIKRRAAEFGVDTSRIATWGTSAGAIATGSMDVVPEEGDSGNPGYPSNVSAHVLLSGCVWPFLLSARHKTAYRPTPWFDVHGTKDYIVFPLFATSTYSNLRAMGLPDSENSLVWVPGGLHEPWLFSLKSSADSAPRDVLRPHVVAFLVRSLRLEDHTR